MKKIDDFFKTIDEQELHDEIAKEVSQARKRYGSSRYSAEDALQGTAIDGALAGCEYLLKKYHEWLTPQVLSQP